MQQEEISYMLYHRKIHDPEISRQHHFMKTIAMKILNSVKDAPNVDILLISDLPALLSPHRTAAQLLPLEEIFSGTFDTLECYLFWEIAPLYLSFQRLILQVPCVPNIGKAYIAEGSSQCIQAANSLGPYICEAVAMQIIYEGSNIFKIVIDWADSRDIHASEIKASQEDADWEKQCRAEELQAICESGDLSMEDDEIYMEFHTGIADF
ncbi:hypothetical protein M422DRAFT_241453 [Sphaerobolus stellatus SS14]|nr:hypothetical protein M422DRAFT_241453 [Sphaerobolus stellatus SS14]